MTGFQALKSILNRHKATTETMDESPEAAVDNDDLVIIVENEAESLPAEEERAKQLGGSIGLMDTCPVCKLNFHNREPKLLPCLHSFCKKCLPPPSRNLVNTEQRRDPQLQADNSKPREIRQFVYREVDNCTEVQDDHCNFSLKSRCLL